MAFTFITQVDHEIFSKICLEKSDKMSKAMATLNDETGTRCLNILFEQLSEKDIVHLATRLTARVQASELRRHHLTIYAVRPDAKDAILDRDVAGFWAGAE